LLYNYKGGKTEEGRLFNLATNIFFKIFFRADVITNIDLNIWENIANNKE
jgi:hypothetical protein